MDDEKDYIGTIYGCEYYKLLPSPAQFPSNLNQTKIDLSREKLMLIEEETIHIKKIGLLEYELSHIKNRLRIIDDNNSHALMAYNVSRRVKYG